jgi:magnesium chelatase subunit I
MSYSVSIPILPYSKVVGHKDLKLALEVAYIAGSRLGGVLISGHRGTGKSTTVRAFAKMMYDDLPVTLPINATEDRVVGGYKIDALMKGEPERQDGLLAQADGKILYIDEVNLLDDHIVNIILDTAATGILAVQRQGIDIPATETRFTLVGTMNPEEGRLRPQLRDRFGLVVNIITRPTERAEILQTVLNFDAALSANEKESGFLKEGRSADAQKKAKLEIAQRKLHTVELSQALAQQCVDLAKSFEAVGHRADYFLALAARAQAARMGVNAVAPEHLRDVAPLVLTHRRRQKSEYWLKEDNERVADLLSVEPVAETNLSPGTSV